MAAAAAATELNCSSFNHTSLPQLNLTPACSLYDLIVFSVIGAPVVVLGLIGNCLCFVVLREDMFKPPTLYLLRSLALADTMVLTIGIFLWVLPPICEYYDIMSAYYSFYIAWTPIIWPCYQIAYTATIMFTVMVSANRYIAICKPNRQPTKRSATYGIIGVFLFSVIYNVPRFFEYKSHSECDGARHVTVYGHSELGASQLYRFVYLHLLYLVVLLGGPIAVLVYLNWSLIRALQERGRKRANMHLNAKSRSDERDLTAILIVVVFVFIACNTPTFIDHVCWTIVGGDQVVCGHWLYFFTAAADMCAMLNSSVNFLIYTMISNRFRQKLKQTFGFSVCCNRRDGVEWLSLKRPCTLAAQTRTTDVRDLSSPRDSDDATKELHNGNVTSGDGSPGGDDAEDDKKMANTSNHVDVRTSAAAGEPEHGQGATITDGLLQSNCDVAENWVNDGVTHADVHALPAGS